MSQVLRREIRFAGSRIILEFKGPKACRVGSFVFSAWPEGGSAALPHYRLAQNDGKLQLWKGEVKLRESESSAIMGEALQAKAAYDLADRSTGGMVLHAACLSHADRALLIPAASGSGKSTLSAWLAARGLSFLCDDVVFVSRGHSRAVCLIRPVQLKGRSREVLQPWFDWEKHQAQAMCAPGFCLVPPEIIGQPVKLRYPQITILLFPKYEKGAGLRFSRISPAQTSLALMECLVNARNLKGHGLKQAIRLAQRVTAYKLTYGGFDQLEPVRRDLWSRMKIG